MVCTKNDFIINCRKIIACVRIYNVYSITSIIIVIGLHLTDTTNNNKRKSIIH